MKKENNHLQAFSIFLGKEGCGKTAVFNKLTDASSRYALFHCCPCHVGVMHNEDCDLLIIDALSSVCSLHHYLTRGPLKCIFVLIEFHPRIGSTLVESFWETCSRLKYDYLDMVVVLITKMDHFTPGGAWQTIQHVERDICRIFQEDVGVERVIFSHPSVTKDDLSRAICNQVKDLPLRQLAYNKAEVLQYFGITQNKCSYSKHPIKDDFQVSSLVSHSDCNRLESVELSRIARRRRGQKQAVVVDSLEVKHEEKSESTTPDDRSSYKTKDDVTYKARALSFIRRATVDFAHSTRSFCDSCCRESFMRKFCGCWMSERRHSTHTYRPDVRGFESLSESKQQIIGREVFD